MEDCKKNEKKWIVEGALIGVLNLLSPIKV